MRLSRIRGELWTRSTYPENRPCRTAIPGSVLSTAEVRMMSLDPKEVFNAMQCAYRHGVMDKFSVIQGEALVAVMEESGWNMGDLLNRLDGAEEKTVMKIDRLLNRVGPLVKYANNDHLMKFLSRLLDIGVVKRMAIANMKNSILKTLPGQSPPSRVERIKAMAGRAA
jgi:hypothetical protein